MCSLPCVLIMLSLPLCVFHKTFLSRGVSNFHSMDYRYLMGNKLIYLKEKWLSSEEAKRTLHPTFLYAGREKLPGVWEAKTLSVAEHMV